MADAKPSGLGYAVREGGVRPEPQIKKNEVIVKRADGKTVRRRTYTNGNVQDTQVFAGDYTDVKTEAELAAQESAPAPRGKKNEVKDDG